MRCPGSTISRHFPDESVTVHGLSMEVRTEDDVFAPIVPWAVR